MTHFVVDACGRVPPEDAPWPDQWADMIEGASLVAPAIKAGGNLALWQARKPGSLGAS